MKEIPVRYPEKSSLHNPRYEIYCGERDNYAETQERIERIMGELKRCGFADIQVSTVDGIPWIEQVHDADYIGFLKKSSEAVGTAVEAIFPNVHPYNSYSRATNIVAERGMFMYDTHTPIVGGTFDAAVDSAGCAVAGAMLLKEDEPLVYALTRPPGHHAERSMMGGYCYFNNIAVAAEYLLGNGAKKVAIFDFDLHHGNGTQDIFYRRPEVLFVSIHASPKIKFPYFSGYKDEQGQGEGLGYNFNFPLPQGVGDEEYHTVVKEALKILKHYNPDYLLVSAGFDTHEKDPIGALKLTTPYYRELGRVIASLGYPILTVQEGGYATDVLGENVVSYLRGLTE